MTATAPELSKSDFFDFVTSNDVTDAQYKQQMRSVNVFMEPSDSRSNPLLSEVPKEQNNNSLLTVTESQSISNSTMATATSSATLQSFDSIWNVDRERERFETAMLEDLNKFCWNQDSDLNNTHHGPDTAISNKLISNNTDGQIYTLTVLNQDMNETNTNRYWVKEEVSISSPTDMEQQPPLDLETILNIDQLNEFNQDSLNTNILPKSENFNYDEDVVNNQKSDRSSNILIKSEPFTYDDFSSNDKKDDSCSSLIGTQNILESEVEFNNNNNDWKLTDQNTESNESLLRSALQGKTLIRSIYQNIPLHQKGTKLEDNELKRVIISNNNKSGVPSMYQDTKSEVDILMSISPENGNISILLDDPNFCNGDNPTSTQSVDDIVLSPLDGNYSEEYEKLKRIASEMGESVLPPYCTVEAIDPIRNVYNIHNVNGELVTMIPAGDVQLPQHLQIVTASPTVTSTKTVTKKYKRLQNKNPAPTTQTQTGTAIQAATSTSNNVRKERSLHYCSICSKGFKDKYSVNVHVRTHTGEKPFACSLCGKSFRQKAHLAKHYQTHIAQKTAAANGAVKPTKQR